MAGLSCASTGRSGATRSTVRHARRSSRTLDGLAATCRAIVLTGTAESFCAGLDLRERQAEIASGAPDTAGEEAIALNLALRQHPAACIAAVNGTALGAGLTLVNSCDLAIAADNATFGCPELGFATYASMAGPTTQLTITCKRAAWMLLHRRADRRRYRRTVGLGKRPSCQAAPCWTKPRR